MPKPSTDATPKGWMPEATKVAIPASNFSVGNSGRKAAVLHITEGTTASALSEFKAEGRQKSAHFVISQSGVIFQCVSVIDTAYANGLSYKFGHWIDPEDNVVSPPWPGLTPPTNPNFQTVSIEREGHYQDIPPVTQDAAVVRVLCYLHEMFPSMLPTWVPFLSLIGHCHISPKARANCPGPHVNYVGLAAFANGPPPPPLTKRYRVKRRYVTQRKEDNGAPYVRELVAGEEIVVDAWYTNDRVHLANGSGFADLADLEALP